MKFKKLTNKVHLREMVLRKFSGLVLVAGLWLVVAEIRCSAAAEQIGPAPCLVLVTLDTTRRDAIGAFGGPAGLTPNVDALAGAGTRYTRAVAPSPLTLPSHATLLTGLDPPQHGVRTNGTAALPASMETLAEVLSREGYATGAFVGSRVLDRRFGLDRGFEYYGDNMLAERIGEYGYPERTADAVTDEALAWLATVKPGKPFFVWVHYYDAHAPYSPPEKFRGRNPTEAYLGEVAFVDQEMGRFLDAVQSRSRRVIVAAVGDHGEALGDHGERTHGIFVYSPTIEVPLVIAGPGVLSGLKIDWPVAIRRLPATLIALLGVDGDDLPPGPGLPLSDRFDAARTPILSEAMMPSAVYGWSPLHAVTTGRWRYILAPRPELYDLVNDPVERTNLVEERPEEANRLKAVLDELLSRPGPPAGGAPDLDPETRAALTSLGYLEGASVRADDGIDPKDGIKMLDAFDRAKSMLVSGEAAEASLVLSGLVEKNPSNLPFLNRLAEAQLAAGQGDAALATTKRALELAPTSVFVNLSLADTLRRLDRIEEAAEAYRTTLEIDPRWAPAWLGLAAASESPEDERVVLTQALEADLDSLMVLLRLAQLETEAKNLETAKELVHRADNLAPELAAVKLARADLLRAEGRLDEALATCRAAAELEPTNPYPALCTGRVYLAQGEPARARPHLRRAAVLGKDTEVEQEASRLLESSRPGSPSDSQLSW